MPGTFPTAANSGLPINAPNGSEGTWAVAGTTCGGVLSVNDENRESALEGVTSSESVSRASIAARG